MSHPFLTIWFSPRTTVRHLLDHHPQYGVLLLACIAGIGRVLDRASARDFGDRMPLGVILALALVFGPLGGLFSLWLFSHLIRWTGSWIGGTADRQSLKTAMTWAMIPSIVSLVLWIPEILLLGSELFTSETPRLDANPGLALWFLGLVLIEILFTAWTFVLACHTIAEAQRFRSAWLGLVNLLFVGLLIFVPILVLSLAAVALGAS